MQGEARTHAARPPVAEVDQRSLVRRALQVGALVVALVLVALLMPGLGDVRSKLAGASPAWLVAAVVLELLCCVSYVAMFHPVFRVGSWRASWRIGWAELGVGAIVPASGAAGLALGAWALHERGMAANVIARRSVAFFLLKSSVNFVAVAVLGALMAAGLLGPDEPLSLTALPAALSIAAIAGVLALARLGERPPMPAAGRLRAATRLARNSVVGGTREAIAIVRSGNALVVIGAVGYWAFDNAVLWAAFHALGVPVPLTVVLLGYLIGQLGGLLPIPGGIGGIDFGLIGMLVLLGAPAAATAAAVLAYRVILFWVPLLGGTAGFAALRRAQARERPRDESAARHPPPRCERPERADRRGAHRCGELGAAPQRR